MKHWHQVLFYHRKGRDIIMKLNTNYDTELLDIQICSRCGTLMSPDYAGAQKHRLILYNSTKPILGKRHKVKYLVCLNCGEVRLYIDDIDNNE